MQKPPEGGFAFLVNSFRIRCPTCNLLQAQSDPEPLTNRLICGKLLYDIEYFIPWEVTMRSEQVSDDLRVIRQVMERTRRTSGRIGGWYMILWGSVWVVGFTANHFLLRLGLERADDWMWGILNGIGVLVSIWLGLHAQHRRGHRSTIWRAVFFWWLSLLVFDLLLIWLFGLTEGREIALLILLTIALGYILFGLFTHWTISAIGLFLAVLSVAAALLLPAYFDLAVGFLGGGVLIASGIWFVRQGG